MSGKKPYKWEIYFSCYFFCSVCYQLLFRLLCKRAMLSLGSKQWMLLANCYLLVSRVELCLLLWRQVGLHVSTPISSAHSNNCYSWIVSLYSSFELLFGQRKPVEATIRVLWDSHLECGREKKTHHMQCVIVINIVCALCLVLWDVMARDSSRQHWVTFHGALADFSHSYTRSRVFFHMNTQQPRPACGPTIPILHLRHLAGTQYSG